MKNEEIYKICPAQGTDFINDDKYKEYFISNEESWLSILERTKEIY